MVQLLALVAIFVITSGLMAVTEAAILSVSSAEVEEMLHRGVRGAAALARIKRDVTRSVVVIVVVTNTINVLGPVLVGTHAVEVYGSSAIGVVTALLTLATIVFSEIIPKSLGTHYAPRISLVVAPALNILTVALFPIVWFFERITRVLRVGERRIGTEEQIRSLVRLGHSAGYIESDETQLVHKVFQLNDRNAADIMTAGHAIVSVGLEMNSQRAAEVVLDSPFSRYPVTDPSGRFVGVAIAHDLLKALLSENGDRPVSDLMREPLFVKSTHRADDLLATFRAEHFHLALVTDGDDVVGLVTLEDVIEELVGEITDEKEAP